MNRRELLLGGAVLAGAAAIGRVQAAGHEHQHGMPPAAHAGLAGVAADCVQKAEVCLNHCLELWAQGEKDMAACAMSVNQLLAICGSLQQMANQNSKHLGRLAKIAMDICGECETECKKFDKHEACRACGESCRACYRECEKIAI